MDKKGVSVEFVKERGRRTQFRGAEQALIEKAARPTSFFNQRSAETSEPQKWQERRAAAICHPGGSSASEAFMLRGAMGRYAPPSLAFRRVTQGQCLWNLEASSTQQALCR